MSGRGRGRPRKVGGFKGHQYALIEYLLQPVPLRPWETPPPLPNSHVDYFISQMNPADVRRIEPALLRLNIGNNWRRVPNAHEIRFAIEESELRGYQPSSSSSGASSSSSGASSSGASSSSSGASGSRSGRGRPKKIVGGRYAFNNTTVQVIDPNAPLTNQQINELMSLMSHDETYLIEPSRLINFIRINRNIPNEDEIRRLIRQSKNWHINRLIGQLKQDDVKQISLPILKRHLLEYGLPNKEEIAELIRRTQVLARRQGRIAEVWSSDSPASVSSNSDSLPSTSESSESDDGRVGIVGEGTLPVISSVEGIKRLIATEQARLRKIKKGYKYESPTMSQDKIEEKIARLKERLKSAKANKGHADVSYFIPKSIKWLKIMADETRVGSDAYNKELLEAVKKLLAELSGKKPTAANKKKTATLEEDRDELEKIIGKKKKGYSKKTPDANKPAPVIIPPSSLTNERANIRAAVERGRTYNKIIDDKQQEDFKVILKAMIPDPEPAQRTKEEIRKERAREAARRQRERDKPSGFTQAQEYNKATKQRQAKAREYGIPTREYTASLKREAQLKKIEEGLEDEEKKKVIREERNKLKAKYTYLDEIMNSDNTDANIANTSSMGEQPVLVEAEVEPPTAPLAGSGMCGCGLSNDPKYVISGKNEEYKLLH
jgi:hypothetical protein